MTKFPADNARNGSCTRSPKDSWDSPEPLPPTPGTLGSGVCDVGGVQTAQKLGTEAVPVRGARALAAV